MFTPVRKLHLSVLFGWGVIIYMTFRWLRETQADTGFVLYYIVIALFYLAIRYSVFKPIRIFGPAVASWAMFSIWEMLAGARNNTMSTIAFFVALGMGLVILLVKSFLSTLYLFPKENYELYLYYRRKKKTHHKHQSRQLYVVK